MNAATIERLLHLNGEQILRRQHNECHALLSALKIGGKAELACQHHQNHQRRPERV